MRRREEGSRWRRGEEGGRGRELGIGTFAFEDHFEVYI